MAERTARRAIVRRITAVTGAMVLLASFVPAASAAGGGSGGFAVGDSVMLGAIGPLQAAGYRVDAVVGRSFADGVRALRSQGAALPDRVLVHLGTNSGVTAAQCRDLVSVVGPQRSVTFVTIAIPRAPGVAASSNAVLADCAARANARLVDWAAYSRANPQLVCPDGIHVSCGGAAGYAAFVLSGSAPAAGGSGGAGAAGGAAGAGPGADGPASAQIQQAAQAQAAQARAQARAEARAEAARQAQLRAEQERAAAEAARVAAELQRAVERLRHQALQDPKEVERRTSPSTYSFVGAVALLSRDRLSS